MDTPEIETSKYSAFVQYANAVLMLNKPVVVLLLLFTTFTAMVVAHGSMPAFNLILWTMVGGALSAGGAGAINQYIDRDLDLLMRRTRHRPLPSGRLRSGEGLFYGVVSCLLGLLVLAVYVNPLSAVLSFAGMLYYVVIYSIWLKRHTVYNIVIGGGAGAVPVLVGWAAATGRLEIGAIYLFALVFLWTPPHFWAYALVYQKDYASAGIPMLPVVSGEKHTRQQIFFYTLVLVALTLLMPLLSSGGRLFFVGAFVSGALFIYMSLRLLLSGGSRNARLVFKFSNYYLAFLFLALILDALFGR